MHGMFSAVTPVTAMNAVNAANAGYTAYRDLVQPSAGPLGCGSCTRSLSAPFGNTSPIAGLSFTTVGTFVLIAAAIAAVGITVWSFGGSKKPLSGRRRRR